MIVIKMFVTYSKIASFSNWWVMVTIDTIQHGRHDKRLVRAAHISNFDYSHLISRHFGIELLVLVVLVFIVVFLFSFLQSFSNTFLFYTKCMHMCTMHFMSNKYRRIEWNSLNSIEIKLVFFVQLKLFPLLSFLNS